MYFHRHPAITIVGASPEPMVQVLGRKVISRPIAGTRRRGRDEDDDRRMAGELKENPKEVAEHIMLVDLARNDVGRIARFGTVHVDELMTLERYSHVMHLTSEVSGELVDGKTPIDVLRATLPAGTVSGAPKVRAMEIIDELEPVKRGPYAGVVGYVDFSGNLDTAIAIRTMFVGPNGASFQAGAGIVADSIPDDEDLECRNKAAALLAAVPAARRMTAKRTAEGTLACRRRRADRLRSAEQQRAVPIASDRAEGTEHEGGHDGDHHEPRHLHPGAHGRPQRRVHAGGALDRAVQLGQAARRRRHRLTGVVVDDDGERLLGLAEQRAEVATPGGGCGRS